MSYRAYPVQKTEEKCDDYEVYVNGERVALDTARVSADPINRRWPGHQRQIEQTELVNFLSLTVNGKTDFHVIPKKKSKAAVIRPQGLGAEPKINPDGSIDFCGKT